MDITAVIGKIIPLGRLGENEARRVLFDVSEYMKTYPQATFQLLNRIPNTKDAYPVANVVMDGTNLVWSVMSQDLTGKGVGRCELVVSENSVIVKSDIYMTQVLDALDDSGETPSPWESWLDQFEQYAEQAETAAASAEASAEAAAEHNIGVRVNGTTLELERNE